MRQQPEMNSAGFSTPSMSEDATCEPLLPASCAFYCFSDLVQRASQKYRFAAGRRAGRVFAMEQQPLELCRVPSWYRLLTLDVC